jgi:hypothetical protein
MKAMAVLIASLLTTAVFAPGQAPKPGFGPGFGDNGCPETSLFDPTPSITGNDFIEVYRIRCYSNCPLYTVRIYADGRLVWHGDKAVSSIGDATARVDAAQTQALIANARQLGFGSLCNYYAMRAFDGLLSVTTVSIGGRVKTVVNEAPSDAPSWLYKLDSQIAALNDVQHLIGVRQGQSPPH